MGTFFSPAVRPPAYTYVDSKTITVDPAGTYKTIQEGLDEALKWRSYSGDVIISLANGDHAVSTPLINTHPQHIIIQGVSSSPLIGKDQLTGTSAEDLVTLRASIPVRIILTAILGLWGDKLGRVHLEHILVEVPTTTNHAIRITNANTLTMLSVTIHGSRIGILVQRNSRIDFNRCVLCHSVVRYIYVQHGSSIRLYKSELVRSSFGVYIAEGSSSVIQNCKLQAANTVLYIQYQSTTYCIDNDIAVGSGYGCYVLASSQLNFRNTLAGNKLVTPEGFYVYGGSTAQLRFGNLDLTGITGSYLARASQGSVLEIDANANVKTLRLDKNSIGIGTPGAGATLSPLNGVTGNNRSQWN